MLSAIGTILNNASKSKLAAKGPTVSGFDQRVSAAHTITLVAEGEAENLYKRVGDIYK